MEASRIQSKLLLILGLLVFAAAAAISAKTKGSDDGGTCGMTTTELLECKPAVAAGNADPPKPTTACCSSLKHANLTCFCTFKNNKILPLIGIDANRAMALPSKCDATQTATCT